MKKEIIIPIALIICSVILGSSYIFTQRQKQDSIERQQAVAIEEQQRKEEAQEDREKASRMLYILCTTAAEEDYWAYMELNKTSKSEGGAITAKTWVWEEAQKQRQQKIVNCQKLWLK